MPTIGRFNFRLPVDPKKRASPKAKIPPSDATSQYPRPAGVGRALVDDIDATPGAAARGAVPAPVTARATSISPLLKLVPVPGMASAVLVNRAATCWAVIPGFTAHTRAAEA